MEKSTLSDTENSAWLTDLTEAEMESITGGAITTDQLDGWLASYNNGTLQPLTVAAALQRSYRTGSSVTDTAVISYWFYNLPPEDRKTVVRAVASSLASFAASYLQLT